MARRSVQWRQEFSFPGDPPPTARRADADDRRALPPRAAENRLAPHAGEEDFRWLQASTPGSPESGSGTPSPQLWAQHPHYDRLYPASAGSSPSRAQAIAGYRREMLDLVRGLPEAAYELSLRDIVESRGPSPLPPPPPTQRAMQQQEGAEPKKHVAAAAMPMDDEQAKKQSGGKKQGEARKQRTMGRTRSRSMERSVSLDTGLLIKLFMPLSVGRKQKVSPKPAAPKESRKKTKKVKQGKKQKEEEEEEWWKKSEFSEAGSSSRTSSTGSSSNSNSSASRNGNGRVNGGSNPQAPARSRSR
jgi:hypothetical protein